MKLLKANVSRITSIKPRVYRIIPLLLLCTAIFSEPAFPQLPNISYSTSSVTYTVGAPISNLTISNSGGAVFIPGQTSTFASGFYHPAGMAIDASNNIYLADQFNNQIKKITPLGVVSVFAGSGSAGSTDGTGTGASFYYPAGIAIEPGTGNFYVTDYGNNRIREITPSGVVTTFAGTGTAGGSDGSLTSATFNGPLGITFDASGNIYIADYSGSLIRKIASGYVSTLAGSGYQGTTDGTGSGASFDHPSGLRVDGSGNVYVTDRSSDLIRKITSSGTVTTIAGLAYSEYSADNQFGTAASFYRPSDLTFDQSGNMYIPDYSGNVIREVANNANHSVTTIAGNGSAGLNNGSGSSAMFNGPFGIIMDSNGNLYVSDIGNNLIRQVKTGGYTISPTLPTGLVFDAGTGTISGTPTQTIAATNYTVTGTNASGSGSTIVTIAIATPTVNPSYDQNFILTYTPRKPILDESLLGSSSINDVNADIQYIDGLGRATQNVQIKASPNQNDMVQPMAYDNMGRAAISYLPYATTSGNPGSYRPNALVAGGSYNNSDQYLFYQNNGSTIAVIPGNPFSQSSFELSPEGRVIEQGSPGGTWQVGSSHSGKMAFGANSANEIPLWTVNSSGASYSTYYSPGTLFTTTGTDENGNAKTEYTDFSGHLICKKIPYNGNNLITYYIYDDIGNLRYVIPPLPSTPSPVTLPSSFSEIDDVFKNFFYAYHYDGRNRAIEKKIPGKDWDFLVYNKLDQIILSQNPIQRSMGIWLFSKYDVKGRVVMTGDYASTDTRVNLQNNADLFGNSFWETFNNSTTNFGYTHVTYPDITTSSSNKVLTANYYDNYNFLTNSSINPSTAVFTAPAVTIDTLIQNPTGLSTGTISMVLGTSPAKYLLGMSNYNTYGMQVRTISQSYIQNNVTPNQYDAVLNNYSFNGLLVSSTRKHFLSSVSGIRITSVNKYDIRARPLSVAQTCAPVGLTGTSTTLAKYDYNELGQLITKHLHGTDANSITSTNPLTSTFLQHVDYRYNSRGWLTRINTPNSLADEHFPSQTDGFAEQIDYDQPNTAYSGTTAQFNGNISTLSWQTLVSPAITSLPQEVQGYVLNYDGLNRLTSSNFIANSGNNKLNETISYDELGNILTLTRNNNNSSLLNSLTYDYGTGSTRSNRLLNVSDIGSDNYTAGFGYDANGSVQSNSKLGTSISYNELGLPSQISFTGSNETITFYYNAGGGKLERVIKQGTTVVEDRSYVGGIEYAGNVIDFVHTPEGRARPTAGGYVFEYQLTDHLGNVRMMFGDLNNNGVFDQNTDIVQTTNYYAFGKQVAYLDANPLSQYKYNGKEFLADVNAYDYGARYYDATIGRWSGIDNAAETSRRWSPYNYCMNNPVRNIDPDGNLSYDWAANYSNTVGLTLDHIQTVALSAARQEAGWDQEDADYQQGKTDHPAARPIEHTGEDAYQTREQVRNFTGRGGDSGGLFYALNGGASGEGFNTNGFTNFMAHFTPFGGLIDFTNSARGGNVGGAVLGLASSAAFAFGAGESEQITGVAAEAAGWQGSGYYPGVDSWRNITLRDGAIVAGGLPGPSSFYTTISAVESVGYNKIALWDGLQVYNNPNYGFRNQVGIYKVMGYTPAAQGTALSNIANGAGGLPQYYIPTFKTNLYLLNTIDLK